MINNAFATRPIGRTLEVNPHARWGVVVMREFVASGAALGVIAGLFLTAPANADVVDIGNAASVRIDGAAANSNLGGVMDSAGDFDGDGFDDLILGTPNVPAGGAAHIVFGGPNLASGALGSGRTIRITGGGQFGVSVTAVGDVNKDGLDDVLIGDNMDSSNGPWAGAAILVFGDSTPADIDLSQPPAGWVKFVGAGGDGAGHPVDGVGDVNQDGYPDMIVGAGGAAGTRGVAYVVFGAKTPTDLNLATMSPEQGAALTGEDPMDWAGFDAAGIGDVNDDGIPDIGVGATNAEPNGTQSGSAYVVYGKPGFASLSLGALSGQGFRIDGTDRSFTGTDLAGLGDMNGDGIDDFAVGSPGYNTEGDYATILFGRKTSDNVDFTAMPGGLGVRFTGTATSAAVGRALAGVGDVDADGHPDALIGATDISDTLDLAALVRGGPALHGGPLGSWPDGFQAPTAQGLGSAVAGLGDINGDGGVDMAIGAAYAAANNLADAGSVFIVYGTVPAGPPVEPPPPVTPQPAATLAVKARPAKKAIPRTGRVVLVRKVSVGPGQKAKITVKTPKRTKVVKTATKVTVKTKRAPRGKVRVRIVASGTGVTPMVWTRTWKVR